MHEYNLIYSKHRCISFSFMQGNLNKYGQQYKPQNSPIMQYDTTPTVRRSALDPIGLNPLGHFKFTQPSIPYRFGIVIRIKQQYWLGLSTENID